jgi:hypothetical protein
MQRRTKDLHDQLRAIADGPDPALHGKLPRRPGQLHAQRMLGQRRQPLLRLDEAVETQTAAPLDATLPLILKSEFS